MSGAHSQTLWPPPRNVPSASSDMRSRSLQSMTNVMAFLWGELKNRQDFRICSCPPVPNGELEILVLDGLDIKTGGWDCGYFVAELELVKDGQLVLC
mmetsp:Transcript_18276/g.50399  ORF Transcript_18276/g.50399 Transcript_18276/m.50399 type:complete len:97 (+) Transcript_18276:238-528(+)